MIIKVVSDIKESDIFRESKNLKKKIKTQQAGDIPVKTI